MSRVVLPQTTRIGGRTLTIRRVPQIQNDAEAVGFYNWAENEILIVEGLSVETEFYVLAHELVHVYEEVYRDMRHELDESLVWIMASIVSEILNLRKEHQP